MNILAWFHRKPVFDLTADAYGQWVRAFRPPFHWFMAQAAEDREALATIGDGYVQSVAIGIGYAVANPAAAEAGVAASGGAAEGDIGLVEMLAQKAIQKIIAGQPRPTQAAPQRPPQPPMQMRGTGRK